MCPDANTDSDCNTDSNTNADRRTSLDAQGHTDPENATNAAPAPDSSTSPIAVVDEKVLRFCHDTLPWLISFSLGPPCASVFRLFTFMLGNIGRTSCQRT